MSLLRSLRQSLFPERGAAPAAALQEAIAAHEAGDLEAAARGYAAILQREPHHAEALHLLGVLAHQRGDHAAALERIGQAIAIRNDIALFHFNLGNVCAALGRTAAAADAFARATRLDPRHAAAWFNLGRALGQQGSDADAAAALRHASELMPESAPARHELARALIAAADKGADPAGYDEGIGLLERRWQDGPDPSLSRIALAHALEMRDRWSEAAWHYEGLLAANPDLAPARRGLGNCLNRLGRMDEALREYREAMRIEPGDPATASGLIAGLNYDARISPKSLFEEHRRWGERFAAPFYPSNAQFANVRDPDRRLRIGYVSPDFRRHPVTAAFLPVIERHDPDEVEAICYHNLAAADAVTARVRRAAHAWRDIAALTDLQAAELFRADGVDILVDLAGHTSRHRLLAFARRPGPVQVSWLGYFFTTGVATVDYFVTDPHSSPPGQERFFTERLVRLPATRFCYAPLEPSPEVNALPAAARGGVTFGCFNNLAKIGPDVLALWARILTALPGARLAIQAAGLSDAPNRARVLRDFGAAGLPAARVDLRPFAPPERAAGAYHDIDIALDPFPFCGGMTSFDALWMGVPVVTLAGQLIAGRQTASMLANLGLTELAAGSAEEYVEMAIALARDAARLAGLRAALRPRFQASPLCDYEGFTRSLERAYRAMWREWVGRA